MAKKTVKKAANGTAVTKAAPKAATSKPASTKKAAAKPVSAAKPAAKNAVAAKTVKVAAADVAPVKPKPGPSSTVKQSAAESESKLTKKELDTFRSLLLKLRESVTGNVSFLTSNNLKPMPISDENVDVNDCEFALTVAGDEQTILYEIEEALQRIENGTYGICEQTNKPIARERLKAVPYARLCIEAQSQQEHGRRPRRRPDLF